MVESLIIEDIKNKNLSIPKMVDLIKYLLDNDLLFQEEEILFLASD